jgi:glycosyltransferase involved in cell wall biosynthesis
MKISKVLVTWNRRDSVIETYEHNLRTAGHKWDELIWVDNGSEDLLPAYAIQVADVCCLNKVNQGVSKGYNRAFSICSGDWILNMGDRNKGTDGWLKAMVDVANSGEVDTISLWSTPYNPSGPLLRGQPREINGQLCCPCVAFDSMMFRASLLKTAGYWREDFGMWGWNDVEWANRLEVRNTRSVVIVNHRVFRPEDRDELGKTFITVDGVTMDYRLWRDKEKDDPKKGEVLNRCAQQGWPFFSPFV